MPRTIRILALAVVAAIAVAALATSGTHPVSAADYAGSGKPKVKIRVPAGQTLERARRKGVEFIFTTSVRARVSTKLTYKGKRVGSIARRAYGARTEKALRVKFSKAGKRAVKGLDSARVKVVVKARSKRSTTERKAVRLK